MLALDVRAGHHGRHAASSVPATAALYVVVRRERTARIFTAAEALLFAVIAIGAVAAVVLLSTGRMSL